MGLIDKSCVPCRGGVPPLPRAEVAKLLAQLNGWELVHDHHIAKSWLFKNFADALAFTNKLGAVAEKEGHHPDITVGWGKVRAEIFTHAIDGLTESDFVLAAKLDAVR